MAHNDDSTMNITHDPSSAVSNLSSLGGGATVNLAEPESHSNNNGTGGSETEDSNGNNDGPKAEDEANTEGSAKAEANSNAEDRSSPEEALEKIKRQNTHDLFCLNCSTKITTTALLLPKGQKPPPNNVVWVPISLKLPTFSVPSFPTISSKLPTISLPSFPTISFKLPPFSLPIFRPNPVDTTVPTPNDPPVVPITTSNPTPGPAVVPEPDHVPNPQIQEPVPSPYHKYLRFLLFVVLLLLAVYVLWVTQPNEPFPPPPPHVPGNNSTAPPSPSQVDENGNTSPPSPPHVPQDNNSSTPSPSRVDVNGRIFPPSPPETHPEPSENSTPDTNGGGLIPSSWSWVISFPSFRSSWVISFPSFRSLAVLLILFLAGMALGFPSWPTCRSFTLRLPSILFRITDPTQLGHFLRENVGFPLRNLLPTELDILKSIVYGGLIESITSLGVVSSAAASGASTLNVLALGLANLSSGLFLIIHNLYGLVMSQPRFQGANNDHMPNVGEEDPYQNLLGDRSKSNRHCFVVVVSFIFFGVIPPLFYGLSFQKTDKSHYKALIVLAASLVCVISLSFAKACAFHMPRKLKTVAEYTGMAIGASALSFITSHIVADLFEKYGLHELAAEYRQG